MFEGSLGSSQMTEAFAKAGVRTGLQMALDLLNECWATCKPDVVATASMFNDKLRAMEPITCQLFGPSIWNAAIRRFVQTKQPEIRREVQKKRCIAAGSARLAKNGGYSTNPAAIRSRNRQRRRGAESITDMVANPTIFPSPPSVIEGGRRHRAGIKRIKFDFDPRAGTVTLASRLPDTIRSLQINGLPILDVTKDAALKWCELRTKQTRLVELWCSLVADPRKTLGEQLTAEIVAQLQKADT